MRLSVLVRALAVLLLLMAGALASAAPSALTILCGESGGVDCTIGAALVQVYDKALPDVSASVRATSGSVENLELLEAGKGELAFAQVETLAQAWRGDTSAGFGKSLQKLRGIANLLPSAPPVASILVTHSGVSDDMAYAMTRALFENLDALAAAQVAAKSIHLGASSPVMPVPLHPGAAKFYREKGLLQ